MNKRKRKKYLSNEQIIDVSGRKNISIEPYCLDINDAKVIEDFIKVMRTTNDQIQLKYYSSNAAVDRIAKRNFWDIAKAKYESYRQKKACQIKL